MSLSEADFLSQLLGTARHPGLVTILGWEVVHFRPARTAHGWVTPVQGSLGEGWPDLTLVRPRDTRLIFAELKRDGEEPSAAQYRVLDILGTLRWCPVERRSSEPRIEVHVWHPGDWDQIVEVLR